MWLVNHSFIHPYTMKGVITHIGVVPPIINVSESMDYSSTTTLHLCKIPSVTRHHECPHCLLAPEA